MKDRARMDSTPFPKTKRNTIKRMAARAEYDRDTIYAIVDNAPICHVGFVQDGQPFVIPTICARLGDSLVLHGAKASRLLKHAASNEPLCITFTLLDGVVLARSTFHSSMNYRAAVIFGRGRELKDEAKKLHALEVITEHLMPGRWSDTRQPNPIELKGTAVVEVLIESASAKIRTGPPHDDEEDFALPFWSGVIPIHQQWGEPITDPTLKEGIATPSYIQRKVAG